MNLDSAGRERIRSSAAKKKELIKRVRGYCTSLSVEFWRIAEFNSRAPRNFARGKIREVAKSEEDRSSKKSGYKNLNSSFEWIGHDRRHSSCENLLKITLRFTCTRYVHYLVKISRAIEIRRLCGIYFYTSKIFLAIVVFAFKNIIFPYITQQTYVYLLNLRKMAITIITHWILKSCVNVYVCGFVL